MISVEKHLNQRKKFLGIKSLYIQENSLPVISVPKKLKVKMPIIITIVCVQKQLNLFVYLKIAK